MQCSTYCSMPALFGCVAEGLFVVEHACDSTWRSGGLLRARRRRRAAGVTASICGVLSIAFGASMCWSLRPEAEERCRLLGVSLGGCKCWHTWHVCDHSVFLQEVTGGTGLAPPRRGASGTDSAEDERVASMLEAAVPTLAAALSGADPATVTAAIHAALDAALARTAAAPAALPPQDRCVSPRGGAVAAAAAESAAAVPVADTANGEEARAGGATDGPGSPAGDKPALAETGRSPVAGQSDAPTPAAADQLQPGTKARVAKARRAPPTAEATAASEPPPPAEQLPSQPQSSAASAPPPEAPKAATHTPAGRGRSSTGSGKPGRNGKGRGKKAARGKPCNGTRNTAASKSATASASRLGRVAAIRPPAFAAAVHGLHGRLCGLRRFLVGGGAPRGLKARLITVVLLPLTAVIWMLAALRLYLVVIVPTVRWLGDLRLALSLSLTPVPVACHRGLDLAVCDCVVIVNRRRPLRRSPSVCTPANHTCVQK